MHDRFTVSEAARRLGRRPRDISDLFYHRLLSDEDGPIVGGRRLIRASLLPRIKEVLDRRTNKHGVARQTTPEGRVA